MTVYMIRVVIPPHKWGYYYHGLSPEECVENAKRSEADYPRLKEAVYYMFDVKTNQETSPYERLYQ